MTIKVLLIFFTLCMVLTRSHCSILRSVDSGLAIRSLLDLQCINIFFGLNYDDVKIITDMGHSANIVLDPVEFFTFFSVLPKLDSGCYTAITYASLEPLLQSTLWFTSMRRVVVLLAPNEPIHLIRFQQESKVSYSSLNYEEVFYMENENYNDLTGRLTLLCQSNLAGNLTEKYSNLWNLKRNWLKPHPDHYKDLNCNDGKGALHGMSLNIAFSLIEPYSFIRNYDESRVEDSEYRKKLKPNSGSTYMLMKVIAEKFGFTANYNYHVAYITIYEKNTSAPGLLEEVAMQNLPLGIDCPMNMEFSAFIDYSSYCYSSDYVFATPLPERLPPIFNIMYPFQLTLWLALGITIAVLTAVFGTFAHMTQTQVSNYLNLISEPIGILFQEYGRTSMQIYGNTSKTYTYLRFLWVVIAFIIVVSYSGNLKASFIIVEFESRIKTLNEMLDRNISLITVNEAASYLSETLSPLDKRIYSRMARDNASIPMRGRHGEEILKLALETGAAMYYPDTFIRWKRSALYRQGKRFPLYIINQKWDTVYTAMIYSKGSYLAELLDPIVRATHDYGTRIVAKVFGDLIPTNFDEDEVDEETEGKLSLAHFYIPNMFLLGSIAFATVTLLAENLWARVRCRKNVDTKGLKQPNLKQCIKEENNN